MAQPNPKTYGELKADFRALLNRDDLTTALEDQFVRDALNRVMRVLKTPAFEADVPVTANTDGTVTIPNSFIQIIDIEDPLSVDTEFRYVEYSALRRLRNAGATPERIVYYTRRRDKFVFYPARTAGTTLDLLYYSDPATISSDDDSVPIFSFAPEAVKYGALSYAADYYEDDRLAAFENRFIAIVNELNEQAIEQEMANLNMSLHQNSTSEEY